jgi:hypothetical protein
MGPDLQSFKLTLLCRPLVRRHARHPRRQQRYRLPAALILLLSATASPAQTSSPAATTQLPDEPQPQTFVPRASTALTHCQAQYLGASMSAVALAQMAQQGSANTQPAHFSRIVAPSCPDPGANWYTRFVNGPTELSLSPWDKGWLAARNVVDPLNAIAIVGTSAIVIGANAYSPYGPGMAGFGRNVGVAYAQDMTGEFFGTFLIPSIFHQNPHYRRMPGAPFYRRLLNTCTQVLWSHSDSGKGMPNFSNIIGFAIDDEIGNLYVPGRDTDLPSSAKRYALTFVLVPTDNLVSEFLPDVGRRVNTHYVFIQRIINAVARPDLAMSP